MVYKVSYWMKLMADWCCREFGCWRRLFCCIALVHPELQKVWFNSWTCIYSPTPLKMVFQYTKWTFIGVPRYWLVTGIPILFTAIGNGALNVEVSSSDLSILGCYKLVNKFFIRTTLRALAKIWICWKDFQLRFRLGRDYYGGLALVTIYGKKIAYVDTSVANGDGG